MINTRTCRISFDIYIFVIYILVKTLRESFKAQRLTLDSFKLRIMLKFVVNYTMDVSKRLEDPVTTGRTRSDFEVNDQKRKKAFPSLHSRRRVNKGWVTFRELDFPTNERPSIYHRSWNLVTIVFHVSRFLTTVTTAPRETTLTFTVSQRSFNEYTGVETTRATRHPRICPGWKLVQARSREISQVAFRSLG